MQAWLKKWNTRLDFCIRQVPWISNKIAVSSHALFSMQILGPFFCSKRFLKIDIGKKSLPPKKWKKSFIRNASFENYHTKENTFSRGWAAAFFFFHAGYSTLPSIRVASRHFHPQVFLPTPRCWRYKRKERCKERQINRNLQGQGSIESLKSEGPDRVSERWGESV